MVSTACGSSCTRLHQTGLYIVIMSPWTPYVYARTVDAAGQGHAGTAIDTVERARFAAERRLRVGAVVGAARLARIRVLCHVRVGHDDERYEQHEVGTPAGPQGAPSCRHRGEVASSNVLATCDPVTAITYCLYEISVGSQFGRPSLCPAAIAHTASTGASYCAC